MQLQLYTKNVNNMGCARMSSSAQMLDGGCMTTKNLFTLLDLCVSSLRRGHANLLYIVPILTDDPQRESNEAAQAFNIGVAQQGEEKGRKTHKLGARWGRGAGFGVCMRRATSLHLASAPLNQAVGRFGRSNLLGGGGGGAAGVVVAVVVGAEGLCAGGTGR